MFREIRSYEKDYREVERDLARCGFDPDRRVVRAASAKGDRDLSFDPDKLIFNPDRRI